MAEAFNAGAGEAVRWWLEWELAGQRYRRRIDTPLLIGRDPDCDVCLTDQTVSRRHALVSIVAGRAVVDATTSLNGMLVGSGRVKQANLSPGEPFTIGPARFRLVPVAGVAPAHPSGQTPRPQAPVQVPADGPRPEPIAGPQPAPPPAISVVPSATRRPSGRSIVLGLAALCIVLGFASVAGVAVLTGSHPSHTPSASATISPTVLSSPTAVDQLPPGWTQLRDASPGATLGGLDTGSISFRTADGRLVAFSATVAAAPTDAPVMTSGDGYSFTMPAGWGVARRPEAGHDLFRLAPPGVDVQSAQPGKAPCFTLYWSISAPEPDPRDAAIADLGTTAQPVPGTKVFSVGGLSPLLVAAVPVDAAFVVMTGDVADGSRIDTFLHLLYSIRIGAPSQPAASQPTTKRADASRPSSSRTLRAAPAATDCDPHDRLCGATPIPEDDLGWTASAQSAAAMLLGSLGQVPGANPKQKMKNVAAYVEQGGYVDADGHWTPWGSGFSTSAQLLGIDKAADAFGIHGVASSWAVANESSWLETVRSKVNGDGDLLIVLLPYADALWQGRAGGHYVVVSGVTDDGQVISHDPMDGGTHLRSAADLERAWGTVEPWANPYQYLDVRPASAASPSKSDGLPSVGRSYFQEGFGADEGSSVRVAVRRSAARSLP